MWRAMTQLAATAASAPQGQGWTLWTTGQQQGMSSVHQSAVAATIGQASSAAIRSSTSYVHVLVACDMDKALNGLRHGQSHRDDYCRPSGRLVPVAMQQ